VLGAFGFFTVFFAPLLTMRLFAEESREGTLELMLTLPVRDGDIVLGKFVGAWLYYSLILGLTLVYEAILFSITTLNSTHFSPDLDHEDPPASVVHFRQLVLASDVVLICTPEYAMGVVGSLKNALDWLVSSSTLSGKPVMLVTASLNGEKGHAALLETLTVIEALLRPETNVLIPFAKTKVTSDGVITDDPALQAIQNALDVLLAGR